MMAKITEDPTTSFQAILDQITEYVTDRIHIYPELTRHMIADMLQGLSSHYPSSSEVLPLKQLIQIAKLCSQLRRLEFKVGVLEKLLLEQLKPFVSTKPPVYGAIVRPEAIYLMEFEEILATSGPGGDVTYLIEPLMEAQRICAEEEAQLTEQKRRDERWKDVSCCPIQWTT